ncbi:MAG: hypothetical protein IPJ34_02675 [Myxococcales bacterium]|nr:hypothetical protein [Myxococcales bacterium]
MTSFQSEITAPHPPVSARTPVVAPIPESTRGALVTYFSLVRTFGRDDWLVYVAWVGLMVGLFGATLGFLLLGRHAHVQFPAEAWMVPIGAAIFAGAIAVDTIGHRTVYKEVIARAEGLVHHVTIFCGVGSCVFLCAAYQNRGAFWIPAMVLTIMSFVYSLVDEVFHWHRYWSERSDRVEMWSHTFIFVGHLTMMFGWWKWFFLGYPGVRETLAALPGGQ